MIILGLTGSIGMGKSTTAKMFKQQGVPVYDADSAVHALYANGPAVPAIEKLFPGTTGENGVDRKKLGDIALHNPEKLKGLEAIIHPLVHRAERSFLENQRAQNSKLVVLDIPLLFETGGDSRVDKILVVTAPEQIQRKRVMARPGMSEKSYNAILEKQLPDAEKRQRAHYVIDTSLGMTAAAKAVTQIIDELTG